MADFRRQAPAQVPQPMDPPSASAAAPSGTGRRQPEQIPPGASGSNNTSSITRPVVVNPYAKKRSRVVMEQGPAPATTRPADARAAVGVGIARAHEQRQPPPQPQPSRPNINSAMTGAVGGTRTGIPRNPYGRKASPQQQQQEYPITKQRPGDPKPAPASALRSSSSDRTSGAFESGIDWDAALSVIDSACPEATKAAAAAATPAAPVAATAYVSKGSTGTSAAAANSTAPFHSGRQSDANEYGDGGIDWTSVDCGPRDGQNRPYVPTGSGHSSERINNDGGNKDTKRPAAAVAAVTEMTNQASTVSATGRKEDDAQYGTTRASSSRSSNPYSLASGIGRPSSWQASSSATTSTLTSNPQHVQHGHAGSIDSMKQRSAAVAAGSYSSTGRSSSGPLTTAASSSSATTNRPSSASSSSRTQELPPLPPMLAYDDNRVAPINDGRRAELIKNAKLSETLLNGWKLLPHQKSGVLRGLKMRRLILAFDMGLGKTLVGCVWARAFKETFPSLKIYCIAPVSLKKEWVRTASDAVGLDCEDDGKEYSPDPELDLHVASWAKIPDKVPSCVENYVVICDEAHQMQNMTSGRTKSALALMNSSRCIGVLLLTGTPMKNGKPANIFPLLRAVKHPFGDNQRQFETFFCNGQQKQFGPGGRVVWDANGSSNLNHLNAHIANHLLHMTKEECLQNLPPKTREFRKVPVSSRDEIKHVNAMNDLARLYQTHHNGTSDDTSKEALLGAFNRVRMIASQAKIGATVRLAQAILEKEPAVVIFTNFVQIAKDVHRKLEEAGWNGHVLTGETPPKKRQPMVDDFQQGLSAVFVCTFGAGGVGLTLTAACSIILLDRPWTPGDALQAEDRVRRIGQTKPVTSIWMRAFDVDEQIDILIEEKKLTSLAVVDRNSSYGSTSETKAAPKISIFQLVNSIIKRQTGSLDGLKRG